MTDPTGRNFLSYRRARADEAALIIAALHDHGVPTWQDVRNLGSVPTEDELRRVLADPLTASAVLFITPEVESSAIIRNVEIPLIVKRAEAQDGFFVLPFAAAGLDYAKAAEITSNCLSAQSLENWNMERAKEPVLTAGLAPRVARRVMEQRVSAIAATLPAHASFQVKISSRQAIGFEPGIGLALDWSARFAAKEAKPETWSKILLPALADVSSAFRTLAPNRHIEFSGLPTLPAAVALGCAFLAPRGQQIAWRQFRPGQPDQLWSLADQRLASGFAAKISSYDANARDLAVLVSVADDTEPLFATFQKSRPRFRAVVHVRKDAPYPHLLSSSGEAVDVAHIAVEGMREARRQYGNIDTIHLFMAAPAGLAVLVGQLLNTFASIQTYEHVGDGATVDYRPAALLHPCA